MRRNEVMTLVTLGGQSEGEMLVTADVDDEDKARPERVLLSTNVSSVLSATVRRSSLSCRQGISIRQRMRKFLVECCFTLSPLVGS